MVKLGQDYENKNPKPRNRWKEFGEFLEDYWWGLLIAGWVVFGGIEGIIKAGQPNTPKEKERAVVVEVVENGIDDYKVKYLSDGAVQVVDLGNDAYIVGDTVLAER
jgi:hypothetical protein